MFQKEVFLQKLISECEFIKENISKLKEVDPPTLFIRKSEKAWSIIEVINHLLLANEFYLVQIIEISGKQYDSSFNESKYNAGWVGQYLSKNIRPKDDGSIKLSSKTFKMMDPQKHESSSGLNTEEIIEDYLSQLQMIQTQLKLAMHIDLKKNKIKTAVGNWFKLELGNAFDFMVGHNTRHLIQIQKNLV